jgi:hypothetical protein
MYIHTCKNVYVQGRRMSYTYIYIHTCKNVYVQGGTMPRHLLYAKQEGMVSVYIFRTCTYIRIHINKQCTYVYHAHTLKTWMGARSDSMHATLMCMGKVLPTVSVCICTCTYIRIHITLGAIVCMQHCYISCNKASSIHVYVYMYVYMCICTYICIMHVTLKYHLNILKAQAYMYVYIHVFTYICMHTDMDLPWHSGTNMYFRF